MASTHAHPRLQQEAHGQRTQTRPYGDPYNSTRTAAGYYVSQEAAHPKQSKSVEVRARTASRGTSQSTTNTPSLLEAYIH
ncbi:hypothetical protein NEOLEDRAFT_341006 [Neolentinus lepideus HHB14362 ss-1]|uniref:Uncharacterized protein n=1 Tax=Neolentinus lepideus HHB14362 ss-1 TaxID=1314782 RepID=A0A165SWW1_9AGAM|nr:hypothetical protein NEOLEDRAFT_341006 [Neolentinus lepideus HHB14362 ss-1]